MSSLRKRSFSSVLFDFCNYGFMLLFSFAVLYPFWDLLVLSFTPSAGAITLGLRFWPQNPVLDAYKYVFADGKIFIGYLNTIFRTVAGTLLALFVIIIAAYPLSKKELPGRNLITMYFLITMFFGGGLIPTYLLVRSLGLIDTRWVLIIPQMMNVFYVIIMRNFFMSLDKGLEESAFIDGASYITVLYKIIIPLSKPVIATVALWNAVGHWNAWFDAMIYTRKPSLLVLQLLLRRLLIVQQEDLFTMRTILKELQLDITTNTARAATILLAIGPIIAAYPFLQKYFVKGIMIGSLKG